jgi:hypothetical protein
MALKKSDAPQNSAAAKAAAGVDDTPDTYLDADDPKTKETVNTVLDENAGAPPGYEAAVEALPEGDPVKDATKAAMQADSTQEEAEEKKKAVEDSTTGAQDTPSGGALIETASISDSIERGNAYAREKAMRRHGYVTPDLQEKK